MTEIFVDLSGVENMHTVQRRDSAFVSYDLFGGKPHFEFKMNQNTKRFHSAG
jgi:hypothetical protein